MKKILIIAKKEWLNYFTTPTGYVFAGLLMLVTTWLFTNDMFVINQADLKSYWSTLGFLMSIFVPAISMNLIAEEKKNSTWETLLSLPINEVQLVVGKFFGCALYLIFTVLLSLPLIVTISLLGKPDYGLIAGGLLGMVALSLSYLSVGIFMSSLSSQAIVGFLGSTVFLLINNLISQESILARLPAAAGVVLTDLSLYYRSTNFFVGMIQIKDLVFFISWITVFLTLSVLSLKSRGK